MTQEEIDALKALGFNFKATPQGEVQFTPEEEAEWAAWQTDAFVRNKATKLAELSRLRWQKTQTFSYDGETEVPADSAMTAVIGTIVGAQILNPEEPFIWKLKAGVFRSWYVADVRNYGLAIRDHIQQCFDREAVLATMIDGAANQAALDAIDITVGWP